MSTYELQTAQSIRVFKWVHAVTRKFDESFGVAREIDVASPSVPLQTGRGMRKHSYAHRKLHSYVSTELKERAIATHKKFHRRSTGKF